MSRFAEDNEQNFKWVTATPDGPLPVQPAMGLKIHLSDPGYNGTGPSYLWAATSPGTYSQGGAAWCYMGECRATCKSFVKHSIRKRMPTSAPT